MRKIISGFIVLSVFLVLMPALILAQEAPEQPNECCYLSTDVTNVDAACEQGVIVGPEDPTASCNLGRITARTDAWAMCCLIDTIANITNWVFYFMLIIAVLLILIGGIIFMTAGGDTEKAGKGKGFITYALIGIAIGLLAKLLPAVVAFIVK